MESLEHPWPWFLSAPHEALRQRSEGRPAFGPDAVVLVSSLFCAALAESYLANGNFRTLGIGFVLYMLSFFALLWLYAWISRLFVHAPAPTSRWFSAGVFTVVPVHLLLPAALIARAWGSSGLAFYELFKLLLLGPMFRRAVLSVEDLHGWPAWASAVFVVAPFVVSVFVILVLLLTAFLGAGLTLLGAGQ